MQELHLVNSNLQKIKHLLNKIKFKKIGYRYTLINISVQVDNEIELLVSVTGIKKQAITFKPEDIIKDDELLSEFSPYDIRTITYLSFQKYIKFETSLKIESQIIIKGLTIFSLYNLEKNERMTIKAKDLYQNYDYLAQLSRKDMIVVISTAIQEQTIADIKKMEGIGL